MYKIKRFAKDSGENDSKESSKDKLKKAAKTTSKNLLGVGALYGGGTLVSKGLGQLKDAKEELTGLQEMYHNTDTKNVGSIFNEGIKSKFAEDPNNITNQTLTDVSMDKKKGKVYLARDKHIADEVGQNRKVSSLTVKKEDNGKLRYQFGHNDSGKTLKVNIPYEDLKKMKQVENPELRGAKNAQEFAKKLGLDKVDDDIKNSFRDLGKRTVVIEGDVASKYIKGSKDYQKYGLKEMGNYIKHNPGRFAKGAGRGLLGTAVIGGGGYLAYKGGKRVVDGIIKDKD